MTVFERVRMPSLGGATEWLNPRATRPRSAPGPGRPLQLLDADLHQLAPPGALRPRVVAGVRGRRLDRDRSPHAGVLLRARYRRVRQATEDRGIDYPVALDSDYAIWGAFDNHYWPALYFVDADGIIRDHQFGKGLRAIGARDPAAARDRTRAPLRQRARRGSGGQLGLRRHARNVSRPTCAAIASRRRPRTVGCIDSPMTRVPCCSFQSPASTSVAARVQASGFHGRDGQTRQAGFLTSPDRQKRRPTCLT